MEEHGYPTKEDLPYPDLDGVKENCAQIRVIAPAYADERSELTAVLLYVYQHVIFEKLGFEEYAKILLEIAITEMKHLELLASAILRLGALPIYTALPPCPVNFYSSRVVARDATPESMILTDIAAERTAIAAYEGMLEKLCEGEVAALIRRIILDEEAHLRAFKRIYRELTER